MLAAAWYHYVLAFVFAFIGLILMGVILLQRGRGVGLAGAFGGAGGNTAFGAKTGDFLTWATIVVAVLFLIYTSILSHVFVPRSISIGGATIAPDSSGAGAIPVEPQPSGPVQPLQQPVRSEPPPGLVPPPPNGAAVPAPQPAQPAPSPDQAKPNAAPPQPAPAETPKEKPADPGSGGK